MEAFLNGLSNYQITLPYRQLRPDLVFIWHLGHTSILPILAVQDLGFQLSSGRGQSVAGLIFGGIMSMSPASLGESIRFRLDRLQAI